MQPEIANLVIGTSNRGSLIMLFNPDCHVVPPAMTQIQRAPIIEPALLAELHLTTLNLHSKLKLPSLFCTNHRSVAGCVLGLVAELFLLL
jgi:hypothetical protein